MTAYPNKMSPTRSAPPTARPAACVLAIGMASVLAACGGATVRGRVVEGSVGRAMVVDPTDARMDSATGVPGVRVEIRTPDGRAVLADASSASDGSFSAQMPRQTAPRGLVSVRAAADDIFLTQTQVYAPGSEQRLLVLVQPRPSTPAPAHGALAP